MTQPPKGPEGRITILDEQDVDAALRRLDEMYLHFIDLLLVHRRFKLSLPPRRPTAADVVSLRSRWPQAKGKDERDRP